MELFALIPGFDTVINILWVALGLGLVIFFHELGHFAVAKWCNVLVERFSIGFGPILWSKKKGETEYALSVIPFGGYVKMLGQDDIDPSQLSSEEIAQDPRSYSAKSVPQRMAIISAGVIMNVITGILFFACAFGLGVQSSPAVLGSLQTGMPAWEAGLESGDKIVEINGRDVQSFNDVMRGVALSSGPVAVKVVKPSGEELAANIVPEVDKRRIIGVGPARSLTFINPTQQAISPTVPGTSAHRAEPGFQAGDRIVRIGDTEVENFAHLQRILADRRGETLDFTVQRRQGTEKGLETVTVAPNPFRTSGAWMAMGQVASIVRNSPADRAGLRVGDKILSINGRAVGQTALDPHPDAVNPIRLPDEFADLHGQEVSIEVKRQEGGGAPETKTLQFVPEDKPGWIDRPNSPGVPLGVPAAGFAYHLIPTIIYVEPGSPADNAALKAGDIVKKMELIRPPDVSAEDGDPREMISIEFGSNRDNWAYAFWSIQQEPLRHVKLHVSREGDTLVADLGELQPAVEADWFAPTRGIRLSALSQTLVASNPVAAIGMGLRHTANTMSDIYLTIRSLFSGQLSYKELHGPIGIAKVAYDVVQLGLADLLLFLGFLSVNLAVLNFLPIPVLDGGHMVFLLWEFVTRKKPSERVLIAATYFGMAFVLGLMLLVLYLDIFVHQLGVN